MPTPNDLPTEEAKQRADLVPEIHAHEAFRKYRLIDLDNSAIERTAADLIQASHLLGNRDLWIANFKATVERIRAWCEKFKPQLQMALVDIRSNKVLFYFVPNSPRYDLKLGDEMTNLEVLLAGNAGIGYVDTLQVPQGSLERFAGPRSQLIWQSVAA